jgi:hypothetical protein
MSDIEGRLHHYARSVPGPDPQVTSSARERARLALARGGEGTEATDRSRVRWRRRVTRRGGLVALAALLATGAAAAAALTGSFVENTSGPAEAPPPGVLSGDRFATIKGPDGPLEVRAGAGEQVDLAKLQPVAPLGPFSAFTGPDVSGKRRCIVIVSRVNPDYTSAACATETEISEVPRYTAMFEEEHGFLAAMVDASAERVTVNGRETPLVRGALIVPFAGEAIVINVAAPSGGSRLKLRRPPARPR